MVAHLTKKTETAEKGSILWLRLKPQKFKVRLPPHFFSPNPSRKKGAIKKQKRKNSIGKD